MQNPPPSQQPYGSPYGTPAPPPQQSSVGMDPKIAAAISYIWIVGLIFFIMEKENRFLRFHALQSILAGVANSIIMFALIIVAFILTFIGAAAASAAGDAGAALFGIVVFLIWAVVWIVPVAFLIGIIIAAVKAYQGQTLKLPIIGKMADKIVNKQ